MKYRDLLRYLVLLRDGVQSVAAESAAAVCLPRTLLKKKKGEKKELFSDFSGIRDTVLHDRETL